MILRPVLLCLVLSCSLGAVAEAQDIAIDPPAEQASGRWWHGLGGSAAPDRVYAGLWALHLRQPADGVTQHWLVGVGWRGVTAGTFINSHGDRSYAVGLARDVITGRRGAFSTSMGYRVSAIRGYDRRLHRVAEQWPVVPGLEVVGTVQHGRAGLVVSYAGIVTSVGAFIAIGQ